MKEEKCFSLFTGRPAFVLQHYTGEGTWKDVLPWDELEAPGEPPIIVIAGERKGKPTISTDTKTSPVYDHCGFLAGYDEEVTFEELEALARHLGMWNTFNRRVLIFGGVSSPPKPALQTFAGNGPLSPYSDTPTESWIKRLNDTFRDAQAMEMGMAHIIFYVGSDEVQKQKEEEQ